jgi:hypothetical protein
MQSVYFSRVNHILKHIRRNFYFQFSLLDSLSCRNKCKVDTSRSKRCRKCKYPKTTIFRMIQSRSRSIPTMSKSWCKRLKFSVLCEWTKRTLLRSFFVWFCEWCNSFRSESESNIWRWEWHSYRHRIWRNWYDQSVGISKRYSMCRKAFFHVFSVDSHFFTTHWEALHFWSFLQRKAQRSIWFC